MNTNNYQKVFSVNGKLQATAIQSMLEMAGMTACIVDSHTHGYQDVLVPQEHVFDATNILYPEPKVGEILSARAL